MNIRKTLAVGFVLAMAVMSFSLSGFVNDVNYGIEVGGKDGSGEILFTVYYEFGEDANRVQKKLVVTEKILRPKWFFEDSWFEFTKGKSLQERAIQVAEGKGRFKGRMADRVQNHLPEVYKVVNELVREIDVAVNNGVVQFNPDKGNDFDDKFWVTGQSKGRRLDVERLCVDIVRILVGNTTEDYKSILAVIEDIEPLSEKEVLSKIVKRSEYSTNYPDNEARENNIALAMEAFDGLVIGVGEKVSFNNVVGKRSRDKGYKEAKIIVDGEFVPGVGGGVCQASTTLFNAVLLSGLKIVESHNHSIPISYVPLGRDAMVSSAADLEFVNNTGAPLYIESKVVDRGKSNTATVRIYGERSAKKYKPRVELETLEQDERVVGEVPQFEHYRYDAEVGGMVSYQKKVIESGYPPRVTKTYLDVYEDGQIVDSKLVRKSRYKGKERVVEYEKSVESLDVLRQ